MSLKRWNFDHLSRKSMKLGSEEKFDYSRNWAISEKFSWNLWRVYVRTYLGWRIRLYFSLFWSFSDEFEKKNLQLSEFQAHSF